MDNEEIVQTEQSETETGRPHVFNSDIFSQMAAAEHAGIAPDKALTAEIPSQGIEKPAAEEVVLDPEDIEGLLQMPFDFMAFKTKYSGWKLDEEQTKRLARLWLKPIQKLCGKYKHIELLVAVATTGSIILEKQLEYGIEYNNRARNAGQGQDQLSEESVR